MPIAGVAIALAWPFARYAAKVRSEAAALEVLEDIRARAGRVPEDWRAGSVRDFDRQPDSAV